MAASCSTRAVEQIECRMNSRPFESFAKGRIQEVNSALSKVVAVPKTEHFSLCNALLEFPNYISTFLILV